MTSATPPATSRTVFDHIPRTAGTSIKAAIAAALGEPGDLDEVTTPHYVAIRAADARRHLAGHLWFCPGEQLAPGWHYATLLRHPIDRAISHYYFYRRHWKAVQLGTMTEPDVVAAAYLDLVDYVSHPDAQRSCVNLQARHFAWRVCDAPEKLDDTRLLEAAIASLEEFDLVGVFDDVQGFVDAYCDGLRVPRQPVPRVNSAAGRPDLSGAPASALRWLRDHNAVDLALYEWARARWTAGAGRSVPPGACRRERPGGPGHRASLSRISFGNRRIEVVSARCDPSDGPTHRVRSGDEIRVRIRCRASIGERALTAGIAVRNQHGRLVHGTNTRASGAPSAVLPGQEFEYEFLVPPLPAGEYGVTVALHKGLSHHDGCYHWLDNAVSFSVTD